MKENERVEIFKRKRNVGGFIVVSFKFCYIIAEISVNHNRELNLAKHLID
jgi:sialic acid synthase SpsE